MIYDLDAAEAQMRADKFGFAAPALRPPREKTEPREVQMTIYRAPYDHHDFRFPLHDGNGGGFEGCMGCGLSRAEIERDGLPCIRPILEGKEMPIDPTLERVAKAIYDTFYEGAPWPPIPFDDGLRTGDSYREAARRALKALAAS